ncbi:MAG TPA: radical SAM protein [Methylocella sp.]|nr:radical SAM protein [Methylocella sp.]
MLSRLTINAAQTCNLGCKYCYALGGEYGGQAIAITPELAVNRFREAAQEHRFIKAIQFIGGEPLLNLPALTAVAEAVDVLRQDGILLNRPSLCVITNLTYLSKEHIKLFMKYRFALLVSIDGPKEIHDALRPTRGGRGSHLKVMSNIEMLRREKIPFDVYCTYTQRHLQSGLSITDLLRYFKSIGAGVIEIVPASTAPHDDLGFNHDGNWRAVVDMQIDAINFSIDEFEKGNVMPYGLLGAIIAAMTVRATDHICPAGVSNLAIASDGDLYTCNMFTNNSAHRTSISAQTGVLTKADIAECRDCRVRPWCRSCLGEMEIRSPGNPKPFPEHCETLRRGIETIEKRLPRASRRRLFLQQKGVAFSQRLQGRSDTPL